VVEGEIAVQRLIACGWPITGVACTQAKASTLGLSHPLIEFHILTPQALSDLVGFAFHRGVVACGPMPTLDVMPTLTPTQPRTIVVAESLADPRNIGAVIRNARALGADLLVTDPRAAHPLSRQAIRAAMGHNFALPLWRADPRAALRHLRQALPGLQVVAASASPEAAPVHAHRWGTHVALLVGHEGNGLSDELLSEADAHVTIPMTHGVDSLNVAAATAIMLHSIQTVRAIGTPSAKTACPQQ
jgi:tRNA G18 (ribose-2'-O)-methylase SpoU